MAFAHIFYGQTASFAARTVTKRILLRIIGF